MSYGELVLPAMIAPVVFSALPLFFRPPGRSVYRVAALLMAGFIFLGMLTVGYFHLPALALLLVGVFVAGARRNADQLP